MFSRTCLAGLLAGCVALVLAPAALGASTPPTISKAFGPTSIPVGGTTSLTLTIKNPNASTLSGVAFTDTFPAGLRTASPSNLTSNCGGVTVATSGSVSLSGGSLAANGSCAIGVNVTGISPGIEANTTGAITSTESGPGFPSNTATVIVEAPPSIATQFGATTVALNGTTSMTFTITNPSGNPTALTGTGFSDTLPSGLVVATPDGLAGSCDGGAITATAGSSSVSLSGASLAIGDSCQFSVNVTGLAGGTHTNTTSNVTSTNGGTGNNSQANLTVVSPPTIVKSFGSASAPLNGTTSLSFAIVNSNPSTALSGIAFTDTLPAGLVVAPSPHLSNVCGGTATAVAGAATVSLAGGTLAASGSCTVTVAVEGTTAGTKSNSVQVSSTEGGTGNTSKASLSVVAPPVITKAFAGATVSLNGTTSLRFTITNPASNTVSLTGVAFSDTLPPGLVVSTPNGLSGSCGGTVSAPAGSSSISLSGGAIPVNSSCSFAVNVAAKTAGLKSNSTGAVSSDNGGSGNAAAATLAVVGPPTVTISSPVDGSVFTRGQVVSARYACAEDPNGPGIRSCSGPVASGSPIDTSTAAPHSFTVTATSSDGQTASQTIHYKVANATPPRSRIVSLRPVMRAGKLKAFAGTAAAGTSGVASVSISLERFAGGATVAKAKRKPSPQCWVLTRSGKLSGVKPHGRRCPPAPFQKARGTAHWNFTLARTLPLGTYVLISRATDTAGRSEKTFSSRLGNRVSFTLR